MDCDQVQIALASQVLSREDSDDAVTEHLQDCAACREERRIYADIAQLLSQVAVHEVDAIPVPDPERAIAAVRAADSAGDGTAQSRPAPTPAPVSDKPVRRVVVLALAAALASVVLARRRRLG